MIQETPLYLLKVNLALIIFYGLYVLILRQKTFFQANRFFLLYAVYISFYLPLIEFPAHFNAPHNEQPTLINQIALPITETSWAFQYQSLQPLQYQPAMFNLTFGHLFLIVYVLGAGYFGMQLIIRLLNLKRIIQQSNRSKYGEQKALIHPKMPVSSFFSYLFWKKENEQFDYLLVEHEKVHMRQWHSLDILVMEVTGVIMWFNPLVKYIANDLRLLHEFIADAVVVNKFGQKSTYTQLLCRQTLVPTPLFAHNFHSFIKNRLRMLQQKKSSIFSYGHYLLLIPTLLGLVLLLMSPSGKYTLLRVQDQLNKIQDQSMLLF